MGEKIGLDEYFEYADQMDAVVGSSATSSVCTYAEGYFSRQAVFSCFDCTPQSSGILAGFCYACSITCHSGHNVEPIYTKRSFRCDCGTIPQLSCSLVEKDMKNDENSYNHNFKGLYCICSRPYPDPECPDMDDIEMLQCCVCEDWLHSSHLNAIVPEKYEEMICQICIKKHPFLAHYALPSVENLDVIEAKVPPEPIESAKCDTISCSDAVANISTTEKDNLVKEGSNTTDTVKHTSENTLESQQENPSKKQKLNKCKLSGLALDEIPDKACFFDTNFRENLCNCEDCIALYKSNNISFIYDPNDSLLKYEEATANKHKEDEDALEKRIESLPHEAKCNVARAIGSFRETISELLQKMAAQGASNDVDHKEQIKQAFKDLAAKNNMDPSLFDHIGKL